MGIDIQLNVGKDKDSSSITAKGTIIEPINDANIKSFGIDQKALNSMISKYNKLNTPILKASYQDVTTTLMVTKAEILGITSEPIIVKTQEFVNNSDVKGTFNVGITDSVSNTSTNTWNTGGTLTFTQKINYGLGFLGGGETSISYSQSWGIGGSHSTTYTIGSTSGVSVELAPKQAIVAELSASRGSLKAKVYYDAFVDGTLHVIYLNPIIPLPHLPKISTNIPIKDLMKIGGLSNSIKSTEDMEVGYYSNSRIEIRNLQGNILSTQYV